MVQNEVRNLDNLQDYLEDLHKVRKRCDVDADHLDQDLEENLRRWVLGCQKMDNVETFASMTVDAAGNESPCWREEVLYFQHLDVRREMLRLSGMLLKVWSMNEYCSFAHFYQPG